MAIPKKAGQIYWNNQKPLTNSLDGKHFSAYASGVVNSAYLIWAGGCLILALILFRGIKGQMLRRYPFFYLYISFVLLADTARALVAVRWGFDSTEYFYAYHAPNLLFPVFQTLLLYELYRRIVGVSKNAGSNLVRSFIFAIVLTSPVIWEVTTWTRFDFFNRYQMAALFLQVVICCFLCVALAGRKELVLGPNTRGMLIGLGMMLVLQSINFASYFASSFSSGTLMSFFTQFIFFAALIVFAAGLWDYEPDSRRQESDIELVTEVNQSLREVVRALSGTRQIK